MPALILLPIIIIGNLIQATRILDTLAKEDLNMAFKLMPYKPGCTLAINQLSTTQIIYYGTNIQDEDIDNSADNTYLCNLKTDDGFERAFKQLLHKFQFYAEDKRTWRSKLSDGYVVVNHSGVKHITY